MEADFNNDTVIFADRYEIIGLLGRGGMGDVFLARDTLIDNSLVALKVLFHDPQKHPIVAERFTREIQATRMITHPNVVRTFDFGSFGTRMYFTMEYVDGITLEDEISEIYLSFDDALKILYQLSNGLHAIHEAEIIHRDIKPSNIIIGTDGIPKYNDFGIAHLKGSSLTRSLDVFGTTEYVAPELYASPQATPAIDIYSLGTIAYRLFTGQMPYECHNTYHLIFTKSRGGMAPPIERCPDLPDTINTLIMRMLELNPEERILVKELIMELETFALGYYDPYKNQLTDPYFKQSQPKVNDDDLYPRWILNKGRPPCTISDNSLSRTAFNILSSLQNVLTVTPEAKKRLSIIRFSLILSATLAVIWYVFFSHAFMERAYSPAGVPGLVAWFDVRSLNLKDGDKIKTLPSSGLSKITAKQVDKARQPTFRERRAFGNPIIEFDGIDDFLMADQIAIKLRDSNSSTLIYVARAYEKKAQHYLLSAHLENKILNLFHAGFIGDNRVRIRTIKNPYPSGFHDSNPTIITGFSVYVVAFDKRSVSVFQNGKKLFVDTLNDSIEYGRATYFSIGQEYDEKLPADFFRGELAELMVYDRALDTDERKKIESLLGQKYLLSLRAEG